MGCDSSTDTKHKGCCPPGSWPALQYEYRPLGQTYKVGEIPVYHVGQGSKVLILFEDIFGIESGRHKSCADTYATMGYNVFLPQLLAAPHVGPVHDVPKIIQTCKKPEHDIEKLKAKFKLVKKDLQSKGFKKYYVVGFCFGMWIAFHLATEIDNFICIAAMHPSLFVEQLFGRNQLDLVAKMKCPAFLYSGSNDAENVKKNGAVVKKLAEMFGEAKTGVEEFPEMQHGWVIRGDIKEPNVQRDIEKTIKMSDEYFHKFM